MQTPPIFLFIFILTTSQIHTPAVAMFWLTDGSPNEILALTEQHFLAVIMGFREAEMNIVVASSSNSSSTISLQ